MMRMKNRYVIWMVMAVATLTSCEKWLSVSPGHEIDEKDLFKTADGYRNALNGIYQEMGTAKLYGQELTWGLLDVMAQYYSVQWCRDEIAYRAVIENDEYNYQHVTVEPKLKVIWETTFNLIANCNNLLKHIETADSTLFSDGMGEMEREVIRGEALALRAFLHFDMLRLFAPAPVAGSDEKRVPYCDQYPSVNFPTLTTTEVLDKVIRDLQAAKRLTADFDTLYRGAIRDVDSRLGDAVTQNAGEFLSFRGYRLNYYAITGMLARVYLYRGDQLDASREANEVIRSYLFDFSKTMEAREGNTKLYDDVIFGLYNSKLPEIYTAINNDDGNSYSYLFLKDREELSEADKDDVRVGESLVVKRKDRDVSGKYFLTVNLAHQINNKLIPVLRLSEMYHIYAECAYKRQDGARASTMLTYLRTRRDAKRELTLPTRERFYDELLLDARKEFTGEGQLFYMYKRLNRNIVVDGKTFDMQRNFVLPLPKVETDI